MPFVIRSMSTTDLPHCEPYHTYLLPCDQRGGAYWTPSLYRAQKFETALDATMEALRSLRGKRFDVAPVGDPTFPTYWALQAAERAARTVEIC